MTIAPFGLFSSSKEDGLLVLVAGEQPMYENVLTTRGLGVHPRSSMYAILKHYKLW